LQNYKDRQQRAIPKNSEIAAYLKMSMQHFGRVSVESCISAFTFLSDWCEFQDILYEFEMIKHNHYHR